jgi:hypothetical protein
LRNLHRSNLPRRRQAQKRLVAFGIAHRDAILTRRPGLGTITPAHTKP